MPDAATPRVSRCRPSPVYKATKTRRRVIWARPYKRKIGLAHKEPRVTYCFHNDVVCPVRGRSSIVHRTRETVPIKIRPHTPKNHRQPRLRAIIEASTCPKIPAAKNAVDIAPIARARPAGSTDSVRYARATGANPAAAIPWQARRIASTPSVGAKAHPKVARVSTLREITITLFRP